MQLAKTDFLHFLECEKSFWLLKNKLTQYPQKMDEIVHLNKISFYM